MKYPLQNNNNLVISVFLHIFFLPDLCHTEQQYVFTGVMF
jgi:hypothetical protein